MTETGTGRGATVARPSRALAALCLALFLTMLDNTLVSVALPNMQATLHAGVAALQWVVAGYILTFASLMLSGGTLGDRLGRRRLLVAGLTLFSLASVLAALAPDVDVLIVARVLQGAGAAASEPGTLSLLRQIFPDPARRARALGIWAAVSGLALALGPVIGGVLTSAWSWRGVFWFNVVVGTLSIIAVLRETPESRDPTRRRLDWGGQLLGAAALGAFTFGVILGESAGDTSPGVLALFAATVLAGVGFFLTERRSPAPVLDLAFFRDPVVVGANIAAFAASFGIFAVFFFLSLYVQIVGNASPAATAARFAPMALTMILAAPLSGRWTARVGPGPVVTAGLLLAAAGMAATDAAIGPGGGVGELVAAVAVLGAGLGTVLAPVSAAVLAAVPAERSGMAASVTNLSREVGGIVAVAVLGAVTLGQLTSALTAQLHRLGLSSFSAFILSAITHGTSPKSGSAAAATYGSIVITVEHDAEGAFLHGLHVSLAVAAGTLALAAVAAALTLGLGAAQRRPGTAWRARRLAPPG